MSNPRNESEETAAHEEHLDVRAEAPDAAPADTNETESNDELSPMEALQAERDKLENQLQRTLADLQNFRKRKAQEMADARRGAKEALIAELLPVLDNFHLATEVDAGGGEQAIQSMRDGLLMIRTLLEGVFERHGVTEIQASGEAFDPAVHEAMGIDPSPEVDEGAVSHVVQRGYTLEGRVLRPSRVMVGGKPGSPAGEQESD